MSLIENYSKELRTYISTNTKFINDASFQTKEQLSENPSIIEDYIERELSTEQTHCLFFYLTYLIQDSNFLNQLIENINKKFCEKNIKAREMPEIHYLIVYKNSEEKFLDENINKIKNYFEDYLKQVKEAEELVKLKQKMEEEERIKLQKEKEERERFILPKINKFELEEINQNSVIISVPLYGEKEIINKNKTNITNCSEKYSKEKIEYVVYLYDRESHKYDKRIIPKKEENIIKNKTGTKYKLEINNLEPNCIYLFLLGVKFGKNYSNPTSNKFYFITSPEIKYGKIFIFGDYNNKNNLVDVNEQEDVIQLPKGKESYTDCLSQEKTVVPLLYKDIIQNISISSTKTLFLNSNNMVIISGQIIYTNAKDDTEEYYEGSFPEDKIIKKSDINYASVPPYLITFPYPGIKIKKICAGETHCLALDSKGEVYSWGENTFGQLGLGKDIDDIIGNPTKIKFDVFDLDGHKCLTDQKPIFYDIASGAYSSLALCIFNNRQILYYWGNGAGILNNDSNIIQSTYPIPIPGIDNIKKIYARNNSIGIFCWDKEKKLNVLYIHGTEKFGIDAGIGMYEKPKPCIVNFFRDEGIDVLGVNFSNECISILGKNKKGEIEVYLRGKIIKRLFDNKEWNRKFMKLEKNWTKDVVSISPQDDVIFFLLKDGVVKKLEKKGNNLIEKEIKIEGYDDALKELNTSDINEIEFQSFLDENFVVFYQSKKKI